MQKFIFHKAIEGNKANDIKDLKGVNKVAQILISALYKSHWEKLKANEQKLSFRNKVKTQFSSQSIKETHNNKGKNMVNLTYVSTLLPSILAKSPKEIIEISKYFKKNTVPKKKKYYAQVSSNSTNTARKILKIKEAFSNL